MQEKDTNFKTSSLQDTGILYFYQVNSLTLESTQNFINYPRIKYRGWFLLVILSCILGILDCHIRKNACLCIEVMGHFLIMTTISKWSHKYERSNTNARN